MNPHMSERRISLVEWMDLIYPEKTGNGRHRMECPLCGFRIEREGFEAEIPMMDHIELDHPGNVYNSWKELHPDSKKQMTLEALTWEK